MVFSNSRGTANLSSLVESIGPTATVQTVEDTPDNSVASLDFPWTKIETVLKALQASRGPRKFIDPSDSFRYGAPVQEPVDFGIGRLSAPGAPKLAGRSCCQGNERDIRDEVSEAASLRTATVRATPVG